MVGVAGGCLPAEPIAEGGDSVIRVKDSFGVETVSFPDSETLTDSISESVSIIVT